MKAIVVAEGGVEYRDVAPPVPGPFDVQVSVKAAALNRADLTVAAGASHGAVGGPGTIVGMEWAGDVVAVGNEVTDLAPGTPVMGSGASGFAEQTVTDFGRVHAMPDAMSYEVAATLPVALATMHNAIVTRGRLTPGESVLIQGASSGVGIMGIQIAKLMGAGIVMGSSTHAGRRSRLPDFGADVTINTAEESWPDQVLEASGGDGVDLIVDQVGASVANGNMRAARVLGRIINVGRLGGATGTFDFNLHALRRIEYIGVTFRTRSVEEIREINRLMRADLWDAVGAGKLSLPIDRSFALADAAAALAYMEGNQHLGKVVLTV